MSFDLKNRKNSLAVVCGCFNTSSQSFVNYLVHAQVDALLREHLFRKGFADVCVAFNRASVRSGSVCL